jgi:hypothetical protein
VRRAWRAVLALTAFLSANFAVAQERGLEYRLEKKAGMPFDFADGTTKFFHELPFMMAKDFARAVVVKSKNPNSPGSYDVQLSHNAVGKAKFRAVADADRERVYCVIFRDRVRSCASFAPPVKDIYNGSIIFGLAKADAEKLAREINASLK